MLRRWRRGDGRLLGLLLGFLLAGWILGEMEREWEGPDGLVVVVVGHTVSCETVSVRFLGKG